MNEEIMAGRRPNPLCERWRRLRRPARIVLVLLLALLLLIAYVLVERAFRIAVKRELARIDTPNGIESLEFIEIGGIQQAVLIRGEDVSNPLLLSLHGGPGYPEIAFNYGMSLERQYVVVYFDQRLAGKTLYANDIKEVMATDSMAVRVNDVIELSEYLLNRFEREKLVLYGGSWGTVLGVHAAQARPDLYSAYVGISQMVNGHRSQVLAYEQTLAIARAAGHEKDVQKLEKLAPYPGEYTNMYYRRMFQLQFIAPRYLNDTPLTLGNAGDVLEGRYPALYSPYYTLKESFYYLRHDVTRYFGHDVNDAITRYLYVDYDLAELGLDFQIPVVFGNGDCDWITPPCLLTEIYDEITAPYKNFHIFENMGHGVGGEDLRRIMFEEIYEFAIAGNH